MYVNGIPNPARREYKFSHQPRSGDMRRPMTLRGLGFVEQIAMQFAQPVVVSLLHRKKNPKPLQVPPEPNFACLWRHNFATNRLEAPNAPWCRETDPQAKAALREDAINRYLSELFDFYFRALDNKEKTTISKAEALLTQYGASVTALKQAYDAANVSASEQAATDILTPVIISQLSFTKTLTGGVAPSPAVSTPAYTPAPAAPTPVNPAVSIQAPIVETPTPAPVTPIVATPPTQPDVTTSASSATPTQNNALVPLLIGAAALLFGG